MAAEVHEIAPGIYRISQFHQDAAPVEFSQFLIKGGAAAVVPHGVEVDLPGDAWLRGIRGESGLQIPRSAAFRPTPPDSSRRAILR